MSGKGNEMTFSWLICIFFFPSYILCCSIKMGILFALLFSPCEIWLKLPKRKLHKLGQIIGQTVEDIAYCNHIMGQSVIVPSTQVHMLGFLGGGGGGGGDLSSTVVKGMSVRCSSVWSGGGQGWGVRIVRCAYEMLKCMRYKMFKCARCYM